MKPWVRLSSLGSRFEPYPPSTVAASQPTPHPKTTPLLEALKAEKAANKDKEIIIRNHAHYKDQPATSSKKDEPKKKPVPAQKPAETAPSGKKGAATKKLTAPAPPPDASALPSVVKNSTAAPSGKPLKPPKAPKQQLAKAAAAGSSHPSNSAAVANQGSSDSGVPGAPANASAAPEPRRIRPVVGLGRGFQAALNGAGVGRAKREKEKDKGKEKEVPLGVPGDKDKAQNGPPSPKRERGPKRKEGGAASGDAPVHVPSILQRADAPPPTILQRESPRILTQTLDTADASNTKGPPDAAAPDANGVNAGARTPKRRGRGRGGNPTTARGG